MVDKILERIHTNYVSMIDLSKGNLFIFHCHYLKEILPFQDYKLVKIEIIIKKILLFYRILSQIR